VQNSLLSTGSHQIFINGDRSVESIYVQIVMSMRMMLLYSQMVSYRQDFKMSPGKDVWLKLSMKATVKQ